MPGNVVFQIDITIPEWNVQRLLRTGVPPEMKSAFEEQGKSWEKDYDKVTSSWKKKHQPTWKGKFKGSAKEWRYTHQTTSPIMVYLAEGTDIRWAIMADGYSPKTSKKIFGTTGSGGAVVARGKRQVKIPKPGIQAREWHYALIERNDKITPFMDRLQKAFDVTAERFSAKGILTKTTKVTIVL